MSAPVLSGLSAPGLLGRVDPQRLQVIHQLFPPAPAGGLLFLARLLAQARGMPCRDGEPEVAVITVQSLRELASRMGWGYDTTHKYVVLFCALGLLMKRRGGGKVELSFALGRYTPPRSLEALDRLIAASRSKVQSYARKVRRRYLQLFGACQHAESPTPHPAESALSDLDKAIQRIQQIIEREPSPTKRQALITTLLDHLERIRRQVNQEEGPQASTALPLPTEGRWGEQTGDSSQSSESTGEQRVGEPSLIFSAPAAKNGRLSPNRVDSLLPTDIASGRLTPKKSSKGSLPDAPNGRLSGLAADSPQISPADQGRLSGEPSPLGTASDEANGRLLPETADSTSTSSPADSRLVTQKSPGVTTPPATNGRLLPKTADWHAESPAAPGDSTDQSLLNVNVSLESLMRDLNVNVKDVAAFLLTVFHEEPCKRGYYYQLHRQYPRPECWMAATIETLVGMYQSKTVKNGGKYFYDRCVALHQSATLPLQTQALVAQYAPLSYAQALAALTAPKAAVPLSPTPAAGQPDQYAAFVARRLAEQRAAWSKGA